MSKYKIIYEQMIKENTETFDSFQWVHDHYVKDPDKWQRTFNLEGEKIQEIIRKYENLLCQQTESGTYNKFSANLAEKFQNEVRKQFPKIDFIGIE